jgi:prepilin-type processing-associated H-X9-DG protein/prepilin-type N-terminal cleavage/methylation domain-containing protein
MDGVTRNGVRGAQKSAGFSLIELLVVIAVVVVLAALIFPALVRAKERARAIKCLSNVKQWTYALHTYLDDNEDYFPYEGNTTDAIDAGLNIEGWFNTVTLQLLQPGLKDLYASGSIPLNGHNSIFICPSATKGPTVPPSMSNPFFNYGFNNRLDPNGPDRFRRQQVVLPSDTVMFTENQGQPPYSSQQSPARHSNRANLGFVDGHAEAIAKRDYDWPGFVSDSTIEWSTARRVYWYPFSGAPN